MAKVPNRPELTPNEARPNRRLRGSRDSFTLYLVCHCGSSTIFANSQIILPQACYQFMT
jgi:hypothetical protein